MRVIEAFDEPVRAIAASPDGRFLAAASDFEIVALDWASGGEAVRVATRAPVGQLVFAPDGSWVLFASPGGLFRLPTRPGDSPGTLSPDAYSGGVAVAPDGRTLAATRAGRRQQVLLARWELPSMRPVTGFDFWSPFRRLRFSPNSEFIAGIDNDTFELRIAVTGGLNGRYRIRFVGDGFLAFPRDSRTVVFGWEAELRVMETRAGAVVRSIPAPDEPFADAAFLGSGRLLATANGTPSLRIWDTDSWEVAREYDWAAGGLTSLTVTADGMAGVCGTDSGRVVIFDVDD
jgi:WD40 repeat protein